jgi:pimeloyl-ACP methyl ester carboxylesterase
MRFLGRLVVLLLVIAGLGVGYAAWIGMEFGPRPPETLQEIAAAPDVRFIEANGVRFAYIEEGQGPLVLLFHGYPETARTWTQVQRRLAAAGYRTVAVYMRGYPPTALASDYSVKSLGQDVLALIDAFGEQSAIVIGHDWGAAAAYRAAGESRAKVSKLVAMSIPHSRGFVGDPTVFWQAPHFLYYQLPWAERLLWSNNFAHIDRIYREWAPSYEPPEEVLADVKATFRVPGATASTLGYYWAVFAGDSAEAEAAAAKSITTPALIIVGSEDGPVQSGWFEKARAAFTGPYSLVELGGVGHFPQLEAPEQTAEAILNFLGPAPPAAP